MKVIDPNIDVNNISLVPRYYDITDLDFYIYDEATQVEASSAITYSVNGGYLSFSFDINDFNGISLYDNAKYQIRILEGNRVIYRGKMIATSQVPQDYKLTTGLYEYE